MRDRKRLFISIDISKEARDYFREFRDRYYDLPGKWVDPNILHITLSFLGNVAKENIPQLIDEIAEVCASHEPFRISLENIEFDSMPPRKIHAKMGANESLSDLYGDIREILSDLPFAVHRQRPHIEAHVTLCRFNSFSFRDMSTEDIPNIDEQVNMSFPVESAHLIESKLRRGGPEYFVLQSFSLGA